jgi:putative transposase
MDHQVPQAGFLWKCGRSLRELIREICKSLDLEINKDHFSKGHVHLFVSALPQLSICKVMGRIKGKTSRKLLSEYRRWSKEFWGHHLWGRGYFAASSGNVTDEVIMHYIATQDITPTMATSP